MDDDLRSSADMTSTDRENLVAQPHRKLIHEGDYVAEVEVQLIEEEDGWSPYLTLEDTKKLDQVRKALRRGDVEAASQLARVFHLTPVSA